MFKSLTAFFTHKELRAAELKIAVLTDELRKAREENQHLRNMPQIVYEGVTAEQYEINSLDFMKQAFHAFQKHIDEYLSYFAMQIHIDMLKKLSTHTCEMKLMTKRLPHERQSRADQVFIEVKIPAVTIREAVMMERRS